jgi:hypothetical protein
MATQFLNQTIRTEKDKEFSDILNTVDINCTNPVNRMYSQAVFEKYKEVSEVINSVNLGNKDIRKKSIKEIMQESFFHGASWLGQNFIA